MIKILFLSANLDDSKKLAVDNEYKQIRKKIKSSRFSTQYDIDLMPEVSIDELDQVIIDNQPQIVHFSGHGSREGILIFRNLTGQREGSQVRDVADLFRILIEDKSIPKDKKLRCVVLSSCYSQRQARAIAEFVDCVIGMSNEIGDDAAIIFAESFYLGLASGKSILTAFELGRNKVARLEIPGQDIPEIESREGIDPSEIFLVGLRKGKNNLSTGNSTFFNRIRVMLLPARLIYKPPSDESYNSHGQSEERNELKKRLWKLSVTDTSIKLSESYPTSPDELFDIFKDKPNILHFSINREEKIDSEQTDTKLKAESYLKNIMAVVGKDIDCIVLNGCYSKELAEMFSKYVTCIIGIPDNLTFEERTTFLSSFYKHVCQRNIFDAYRYAREELRCIISYDKNLPELIPENDLTLNTVILGRPNDLTSSNLTKEEFNSGKSLNGAQ